SLVAAELAPHVGAEGTVLLVARGGRRLDVETLLCCRHGSLPQSYLIRGSRRPYVTSAIRLNTTRSTANMHVWVCTLRTSDWPIAVINRARSTLMRKICAVIIAQAKLPGIWSEERVITGIMLLRRTWKVTTGLSPRPLARAVRT